MSYCIECNTKNGHLFGCPESNDEDYLPAEDPTEYDDDVPEYDVEWDGRGLSFINFRN